MPTDAKDPDAGVSSLPGAGEAATSPPLLVDAMLGTLARRLRLLGYDARYEPATPDAELARIARETGRVLVTADRSMARRKGLNVVLVQPTDLAAQLKAVLRAFPPAAGQTHARCSVCNGVLVPLDRDRAAAFVPVHVLRVYRNLLRCAGCGRVYWQGSHWRRMVDAGIVAAGGNS